MGPIRGQALVVEDDLLLSCLLQDMLERIGFSVRTVNSAAEAQDVIRTSEIDFLLTDLPLDAQPAGLAIAEQALRHNARMRVVVASGHPRPCELPGPVQFLQKPFTTAQLQRAICF